MEFNRVIDLDSNYAAAYALRGNLYFLKNELLLALRDNQKYTSLLPEDSIGYGNQAFLLFQMGKFREAEKLWKKAIKLPDAPDFSFAGLAVCLWKQNNKKEAIRLYKKAIQLDKRWLDDTLAIAQEFIWPPQMIRIAIDIGTTLN